MIQDKIEKIYSEFIAKKTYNRWLDGEKRRESWPESIQRYKKHFLEYVPTELKDEFDKAVSLCENKLTMPSMRALWSAGPALEENSFAAYNCAYVEVNSIDIFGEILYILMHGTGVGFSVERQFIANLPEVPAEFTQDDTSFIVQDSKLGWKNAFDHCIFSLYGGIIPTFDFSQVRPKGARLMTFGGRASGPEPLNQLFKFTTRIFKAAAGRKLNSLECHDICTMTADVVVSGGVRRSACISFSNLSDQRMKHAKDGQFWIDNPQRAMANNSIAYTEKPDSALFMEEWLNLLRSGSGERGIFNTCTARAKADIFNRGPGEVRANPCLTGDTLVYTQKGEITIIEIIKHLLAGNAILVLSYNIDQDALEWQEVYWGDLTKRNAEVIIVELRNGAKIKCTVDHKVYTVNRGYIKAANLTTEDVLLYLQETDEIGDINDEINYKMIKVLKVYESDNEDVYDINVENNHNFFANKVLVHNCVEALLKHRQLCNLTEVVIKHNDTAEIITDKITSAVLLGCIQSMETNFQNVSDEWKTNAIEERLIGVSMTGICDNQLFKRVNDKTERLLKEFHKHAIQKSIEFAKQLGIVAPKQVTLLKPSGNISQLCNCSSGLHTRYSDYYIRRVRVNSKDPISHLLISKGVNCNPEVGQTWENYTTLVFDFPMKSPRGSLTRSDMTALEQLSFWKMFNDNWCDGNPSVTIYVKDDEWVEVGAWVHKNWESICGLSFLPYDGGNYPLAPYEEITREQYHAECKKWASINIDFDAELNEFEDATDGAKTLACTGNNCEL